MDDKLKRRFSELEQRLVKGQISRREFLRSSAILGFSLGAARIMTACGLAPETPKPFDPIETIYSVNYITTTPDGSEGLATSSAALDTSEPAPSQKFTWFCASCGESFRTLEEMQKHATKEHAWRIPAIQRIEKPTYTPFLVDQIERFDQKNIIFSRTMWDKSYQAQVQEASAKAPRDLGWDIFEGNALAAGAIYVDATAGAIHPNYYGYSGHVRNTPGLYSWDNPVNSQQYPVDDPFKMSERVKQVARIYGANLVGITEIDRRWVYSHYFELATGDYGKLEIPFKYAIVMGIEMDWKGINESPRPEASAATALVYSKMAEVSGSLAAYIRALGYPAVPCGNDTTQSIPLAIDAGLGELGRNGLMLSPEFGPRQRLCKVLTDLPLVPDKPIDFGIQSYCETCHACASACPKDAILWGDRTTETTSISNRKGILRWPVNVGNCFLFWRENGVDCSNCIAACPWALHSQRDWLEL